MNEYIKFLFAALLVMGTMGGPGRRGPIFWT